MAKSYPLEPIIPVFSMETGVPSILIDRETATSSSNLVTTIMNGLMECKSTNGTNCPRMEFYHDITGAEDSPKADDKDVSISSVFRDALIHLVFGSAN